MRHQHERDPRRHRCRPPKTLERQRVPTSDDAPDATNRRSPKTGRPRERGPSRETRVLPAPRGEGDFCDSTSRGNAAEEGGARRQPHRPRAHRTHHARHDRAAGAAKTQTPAGGTHATEDTGEEPGGTDGTGSPPPPFRSPVPQRLTRGGWRGAAHAGTRTVLPPTATTRAPRAPAHTAGRQALPRVIPPRTRSGEARAAVDERANASRRRQSRACHSRGPFGRDPPRDRKAHPFLQG